MFFRKLLRCSFCGKDQTEVSKLVAGPRVYICDECASIVSRIIDGSYGTPSPPPSKYDSKLVVKYRSGRSPDWVKNKNPDAPAVKREAEEEWGRWSAAKPIHPSR
jgi:hypothetical protein